MSNFEMVERNGYVYPSKINLGMTFRATEKSVAERDTLEIGDVLVVVGTGFYFYELYNVRTNETINEHPTVGMSRDGLYAEFVKETTTEQRNAMGLADEYVHTLAGFDDHTLVWYKTSMGDLGRSFYAEHTLEPLINKYGECVFLSKFVLTPPSDAKWKMYPHGVIEYYPMGSDPNNIQTPNPDLMTICEPVKTSYEITYSEPILRMDYHQIESLIESEFGISGYNICIDTGYHNDTQYVVEANADYGLSEKEELSEYIAEMTCHEGYNMINYFVYELRERGVLPDVMLIIDISW